MTWPQRIGFLTPSSNTALEPITQAICAPLADRVTCHFSRFPVTRIALDADALAQFDPAPMVAAARLLADARVDAIIWNGTSGAWLGLEADRSLCEAIQQQTGIVASTSVLAQVEALQRLGVRRYSLVTPYTETVNAAIERTLANSGFECVYATGLGITVNHEFNLVPLPRVREHVASGARADADAIVVVCTNFPAAYVVDALEQQLGVPILDSTIAGIWQGLRLIGWRTPVAGWGRLLRAYFDA